uniref:Uncharacterized protein n=2 Tax=Oryza TaxID=4527 RepID=Q10T13_ORYSJ|nr:hypothetical protein LOC_Os03g01450 [Oryza sativa Japonica Group]
MAGGGRDCDDDDVREWRKMASLRWQRCVQVEEDGEERRTSQVRTQNALKLWMTNEVGRSLFAKAGELGAPVGIMMMKNTVGATNAILQ